MPLSAIQPERYDALLDSKLTEVAPRFAPFFAGKPKVVRSSPSGFRLRAEFRIWHEGDDLNYVMFRRGAPKQPIPIEHFPIASPKIQQLMPRLLERLRSSGSLRKKLFQVEFLSTLEGDTAITLIYPELKGRLNGHAVRVPLLNASLTDCVFEMDRETTEDEVNALFKEASEGDLAGILGYETRPLVSSDYTNDTRSSIVDAPSTMVVNGTQVKIYAWYDNEMGYAHRLVDVAKMVGDSV